MKRILLFCLTLFVAAQAWGQVSESFDTWSDNSYIGIVTFTDPNGGMWENNNCVVSSSNARSGNVVRFNDDSGANEYLLYKGTDGNGKDNGIGVLSFWYRHWNGDGSTVSFQVEYSTDGGSNWTNIGTQTSVTSTTYTQFSETVNLNANDVLIRVRSTEDDERLLIDDFEITDFSSTTIVGFSSPSVSVGEDAGTLTATVCVDITNEDGSAATNADVVLTGGTATNGTDISTYTSSTPDVTFAAGSNTQQCVTITITDDSDFEGDETLIFELQNVTGGNSAAAVGNTQMTVTITDNDIPLVITEIFYNPDDDNLGTDNDYEFLEIYNTSAAQVDLENYTFSSGITYTFSAGATIDAGEYIIVAKNASTYTAAPYNLTLNDNVFEWTSGSLSNSGEAVTLQDNNGATMDNVTYSGSGQTDGDGPSWEVIDPALDNSSTNSNWQVSPTDGGSPAAANEATIWRGTTDMTWATAANWSNGVPTASLKTYIDDAAPNDPTLTGTMNTDDLIIENGRTLTLPTGAILNVTNDLEVNTGGSFNMIDGTLNITDNFTIDGTVDIDAGIVTVGNDFDNNGTTTLDVATVNLGDNFEESGTFTMNSGTLVFNGDGTHGSQSFAGDNNVFNNITINNTNGDEILLFAANMTINGTLTLTSGLMDLTTNNVTIASGGSISGGTPTSYIQTSSTGTLTMEVGNSNVLFPVGNSSYNPITLNEAGTQDNFSVRVVDAITEDGTDGGTAYTENAVNRMWMVSEATGGNANVTMTLLWNNADELTNFDETGCLIANYSGGWQSRSATIAATGSDPYTISTSNITSFSPFAVVDPQLTNLPVELIAFNATPNHNTVSLDWATATEKNNSHFEVERSTNGKDFSTIGTVEGSGTTVEPQAYNFVDAAPANGINYYRLKQVDFDGAFAYSDVVSIEIQNAKNDVVLLPNPVTADLNVQLPTTWTGETSIEIFDIAGRLVQSEIISDNATTFQLAGINNGQYIIRIINADNVITKRFVKQ